MKINKYASIVVSLAMAVCLIATPAIAADQRIQYTEEMVGANHPTKADTLNRALMVEHATDGTHTVDHVAEKTAGHGVAVDGVTLKDGGALTITGGTNTFNVTNGTASLDVAAGATVNVDASLTVEAASVVNQDMTTDASPTFATVKLSGLTDGYIPKHTSDAVGLADSPLSTDGTNTIVGTGALYMKNGVAIRLYKTGDANWGELTFQNTGGVDSFNFGDNAYFSANVSALTFTDRTPHYSGDALTDIAKIKGIDGKIDHASLPIFVQVPQKRAIMQEQPVTRTRQKTVKAIKQVQETKVEKIDGKYVQVATTKSQEVDEPVFESVDLYEESGTLLVDKTGVPLKHNIPVMEEYQTTEKVKVGEEDVIERDLGAMISILTVAVQQLTERVKNLENK